MTTMTTSHKPDETAPAPRAHAYLLHYAIRDDLRFLSHHDEITMLTRSLVRARLPLVYSQGFNPSARLSLLMPRNLGVASESQWAKIMLAEPDYEETALTAVQKAMPQSAPALAVQAAPAKSLAITGVTYEVPLRENDATTAATEIEKLLAEKTFVIDRNMGPKKPRRKTDIRGFIESLNIDEHSLQMVLSVDHQASARPEEILTALTLPATFYLHRVVRTELRWQAAH